MNQNDNRMPVSKTAVSSDTQEDNKKVSFPWGLPLELRGMIFDFAYGQETDKPIVPKAVFDAYNEELIKQGLIASVIPFYEHGINRFIVCKQYFMEAVESFSKTQTLQTMLGSASSEWASSVFSNGLFKMFITRAKVSYADEMRSLLDYSRLNTIELLVDTLVLGHGLPANKCAWLQPLDDRDMTSLTYIGYLKGLRGISNFSCSAHDCFYADTRAKKDMWNRNVQALEDYLKPRVTAPKESAANSRASSCTGRPSLYHGSRVSAMGQSPDLLPKSHVFSDDAPAEDMVESMRRALGEEYDESK